jgi:hypothetical protein
MHKKKPSLDLPLTAPASMTLPPFLERGRGGRPWPLLDIFDRYLRRMKTTGFMVYVGLCHAAGENGVVEGLSQAALAAKAQAHEEVVRRALARLQRIGLIRIEPGPAARDRYVLLAVDVDD